MTITYDSAVDAMNVQLSAGTVAETIEVEPRVLVDVDALGHPLSIEFIVARDFFPFLERHGGRLDATTIAHLVAGQTAGATR